MKRPAGYFLERDEDALCRLDRQAFAMAKDHGVHILRDRIFSAALLDAEGRLAGALWTGGDSSTVTFDVVVNRAHQRRGLGGWLVDLGLSDARDYEDCGHLLELHVISPESESLLHKRGLVQGDIGVASGCVMVRPTHPLARPDLSRDQDVAARARRDSNPVYVLNGVPPDLG